MRKQKAGRTGREKKEDRQARKMNIATPLGMTPVMIRGSKLASNLGRYLNAVGQFLRSGKTEALEEFEGQSIAGHRLITDPDMLNALAQAGALELDRIYASPESGS